MTSFGRKKWDCVAPGCLYIAHHFGFHHCYQILNFLPGHMSFHQRQHRFECLRRTQQVEYLPHLLCCHDYFAHLPWIEPQNANLLPRLSYRRLNFACCHNHSPRLQSCPPQFFEKSPVENRFFHLQRTDPVAFQ